MATMLDQALCAASERFVFVKVVTDLPVSRPLFQEPECCKGYYGKPCHPCPGPFDSPCYDNGQVSMSVCWSYAVNIS